MRGQARSCFALSTLPVRALTSQQVIAEAIAGRAFNRRPLRVALVQRFDSTVDKKQTGVSRDVDALRFRDSKNGEEVTAKNSRLRLAQEKTRT